MSVMIDKVAEDMRLAAIQRGNPIHPALAHHLAVTALNALKKPTDAMLLVYTDPQEAEMYWQAMLNEALK